ncbi:MAG: hypothetical protein AB7R69_01205 [Candidatus Babeliales bacterium]
MFLSRYKNFALAALLFSIVGTAVSGEQEKSLPKGHSAADWYFNVRTNLNSAAIIAGTYAVSEYIYLIRSFKVKGSMFIHPCSFADAFYNASQYGLPHMFSYAGMILALKAIDKLWLSPAYYKSLEEQNKAEHKEAENNSFVVMLKDEINRIEAIMKSCLKSSEKQTEAEYKETEKHPFMVVLENAASLANEASSDAVQKEEVAVAAEEQEAN